MIKITTIFLIVFLSACGPTNSPVSVKGHINKDVIKPDQTNIPDLISEAPVLPEPALKPKTETYTVVVNDVDVASLLFALARDAKINIDIYQDIQGKVTLNAIDQTLD
ncbi:MAG: type II and III secretion system protein, partial [Gammaproteobacteria bacterium]|nr:type II and III secretion system protein [Gammaproteobacteria bacterium]